MTDITDEQIKKWRETRIKRVNEQIGEVLKAQNCELQTLLSFTPDGRVMAQITIVAR